MLQRRIGIKFPKHTIKELCITTISDTDHVHKSVTGRSVSGIIALVESTPMHWKSTRETSMQTSTFWSAFTAMKKAMEMAVTTRCHLRCLWKSRSQSLLRHLLTTTTFFWTQPTWLVLWTRKRQCLHTTQFWTINQKTLETHAKWSHKAIVWTV